MLEVNDLHVRIAGSKILSGVSFTIRTGEKLGLIGPNGSGKTTLFNCLSGFQPARSGTVLYRGTDITGMPPSRRAQLGIGRIFQNFGVFREMTVLENMLTAIESRRGGLIFPWSAKHRANCDRARAFLQEVGLEEKSSAKAGSLSGGQMRLLEISRAIAFEAELFLLDEPTAGVSPKMRHKIEETLGRLQNLGKTILVIEHDMSFIQKLCERIIVLDSGRIVLDGAPEVVRADPLLQEIYFGAAS